MRENQEGAITVFFSIIMLLLITLTGMVVDGARIRAGESIGNGALNTALYSVFANFNETLQKDYGLFALELTEEELGQLLSFYLDRSLNPMENEGLTSTGKKPWDLYQFSVEGIEVAPLYSLREDQVFIQQILEFMKYRAPKSLLEEGLDYVFELKKVGEAAVSFQEKMKIERNLDALSQFQRELEGIIEDLKAFPKNPYLVQVEEIKEGVYLKLAYDQIKITIIEELSRIRGSLRELEGEERITLEEELKALENQLGEVNLFQQQIVASIEGHYQEIRLGIEKAINDCNRLRGNVKEIEALVTIVEHQLTELEKRIFNNSDEDMYPYYENMKVELKNQREFLKTENLEELISIIAKNEGILKEGKSDLERIYGISQGILKNSLDQSEALTQSIQTFQQTIGRVDFELNYEKPRITQQVPLDINEELKDTRKDVVTKVYEFLDKATERDDIVIAPEKLESLPSKGLVASMVGPIVEFDENQQEQGYSEDSLGSVASLGKVLQLNLEALRNKLYINEYSIGIFKNALSNQDGFQFNLRNQLKTDRNSFFDYEVEYILYGMPSQEKNLTRAKIDLLGTRFVLNLLYVYQDAKLERTARTLAIALSAPLGGASMPLIKTLILCGWAMEYALEDVNELMQGEKVSFLRGSPHLQLDYQDYLKLFLLKPNLTDPIKINRIKDLIQLNLQVNPLYPDNIELGSFFTHIQVEVKYTTKVIFLKQFSSNNSINPIKKDRYQLRMLRWQGY